MGRWRKVRDCVGGHRDKTGKKPRIQLVVISSSSSGPSGWPSRVFLYSMRHQRKPDRVVDSWAIDVIVNGDIVGVLDTQCSTPCGDDGVQTRVVVCRDARGHVTNACREHDQPATTRSCPSQPACPSTAIPPTTATAPNRPPRQKGKRPIFLLNQFKKIELILFLK